MPNFDAGTSVGKYELEARAALATQKQLIANYQLLAKVAGFKPPPIPTGGGASSTNAAALAQQKLATETQKTAIAANTAARAAQSLSTEENKTAREAANAAAAQDRAAKSALNLASAQQRAARASQNGGPGPALPRTFAGFTAGGLGQAAGAFGLATIGPQLIGQTISLGIESGKAAIALRETKNSLRAVAPDAKAYADTLLLARQQQALFGGSLQENIEGLQGLTVASRQSGASVKTLLDLSQRLNVLSPEQGTAGARIAISEALSGNITSLSRRFEIPKSALKGLADESLNVEERLQVLDTFLNNVGVTSAAVAGKVDQDALAFRRLNQELGDLQLSVGDQLATSFSGAATGLGRLLGLVNQNPQAVAELKALLAGQSGVSQGDIERQARNARVATADDAIGGARNARLQAAVPTSLFGTFDSASADAQTGALDAVRNRMIVLSATSDEMRDKVVALAGAFRDTGDEEALNQGLRSLETAHTRGSRGAREQTDALAVLRAEMQQSAQASQLDAAQKDAQGAVTALLAEKSKLAVDQFLALNPTIDASAAASLAAAQGYDPQIRKLIELGIEARNAKNELGALNGGGVVEGRAERDTPGDRARARTAGLQLVREQTAAQAQAEADRLSRTGSTAQKLARAQADAAKLTGTARFEAETKVLELQSQLAREQGKGDRAHVSAGEKAVSLAERERDAKQSQLKATLDAAAAAIKDRQDRRKEDRELQAAQRILNSPRASQQFKDAAADKIALIEIERQQRALDIQQKQATAGGAIVNGRILQSIPGGGTPVPAGPVPTAAGRAAQAQTATPQAGAGAMILRLVDSANRVLAEGIAPFILQDLQVGLAQSQSAG